MSRTLGFVLRFVFLFVILLLVCFELLFFFLQIFTVGFFAYILRLSLVLVLLSILVLGYSLLIFPDSVCSGSPMFPVSCYLCKMLFVSCFTLVVFVSHV